VATLIFFKFCYYKTSQFAFPIQDFLKSLKVCMVDGSLFIDNHIFCGGSWIYLFIYLFIYIFQFCKVGGLAYGLNKIISKQFVFPLHDFEGYFRKKSFVQSC